MNNEPLNFVYSTVQVANVLNIGRSTVNKYARSLEDAGYAFVKDDKERRAFTDHDIIAFRALLDLLDRGVEYASAINAVVERYKPYARSDSLAVVATPDSRPDVAMLNAKVDELVQAVSLLSSKIDKIVDERVRDQVAAAASGISDQVNQVLEEVRSERIQTNEKLDVLASRIEAHGKRKKFLGLF
ncbi:hypothetical protein [Paenibacillus lautus]|uniref:hypothetical protein n=1 Tax=Paenibacillus lautus TaxID=1401 RepID=UPI001C7DFB1C|nr:hypothetical protein [Paenibacillus lautus]MBX4152305.1 hypothetical protein [Paenibacillus lautus]